MGLVPRRRPQRLRRELMNCAHPADFSNVHLTSRNEVTAGKVDAAQRKASSPPGCTCSQ